MSKRTVQDNRLRATVATTKPIKGTSNDRHPTGRPRAAPATSQGIKTAQVGASRLPAGLARHERSNRPRTNQANAVVIPQAGQRSPVTSANAQGARPS